MLIYEVNADVRLDRAAEYRAWLESHMPQVVEAGSFRGATLFEPRDGAPEGHRTFVVHYEAENEEQLERYLNERAGGLRKDATDRFGDSFRTTRRVLRAVGSSLSGVLDRRAFEERLTLQWRMLARAGQPLGLVLVSLDRFEAFRDPARRAAADEALRLVAQALTAVTRRVIDSVARIGGDKFALLLPDTDGAGAMQVAEYARAAISAIAVPGALSPQGFLSANVGLASLHPGLEADVGTLMARAEAALGRAKETSGELPTA
jgi:diguanylate cyclase (GGDEF)-like protein